MRTIFKTLSIVGLLSAAGIASASGVASTFRVNVPFAFTVGSEQLPAGAYTVEERDSGVVLVTGNGQGALLLTVPSEKANASLNTGLVFQAGHLAAIQTDGGATRAVPMHVTPERTLAMSR